jgi:hypothetical protein
MTSSMEDIDMVEDMTVEVEVIEREHQSELECSEGHTTFACLDSKCSTWHRVEKSEEESGNEMKCV